MDGSDPARDKQLTDARDLALKVKAIDPDLRGIELPLYFYAQEHNDFDGARRALEAAIAKDPKNPSAYGNFGLFHLDMGEPERALPLLRQALSLYPKGNEFIFDNLGRAYLALGDNDAAIEWLLKAVDLNTEIRDVYRARHGVLRQGRPAKRGTLRRRVSEAGDRARLEGERKPWAVTGKPAGLLEVLPRSLPSAVEEGRSAIARRLAQGRCRAAGIRGRRAADDAIRRQAKDDGSSLEFHVRPRGTCPFLCDPPGRGGQFLLHCSNLQPHPRR